MTTGDELRKAAKDLYNAAQLKKRQIAMLDQTIQQMEGKISQMRMQKREAVLEVSRIEKQSTRMEQDAQKADKINQEIEDQQSQL